MSNLGSSFGTAIAGTIIVSGIASTPGRSYALAMMVLGVTALGGLIAAAMLPRAFNAAGTATQATPTPQTQ